MMTVWAQGLAAGVGHWVIVAIIVAAVIGIAMVAIRASGVAVPSWLPNILWIVVIAAVAVVAIKFLLSIA